MHLLVPLLNPRPRERTAHPPPSKKLSRRARAGLIEELIAELERHCDSVLRLYLGLPARSLATSDEILTCRYGEQVAALTAPEVPTAPRGERQFKRKHWNERGPRLARGAACRRLSARMSDERPLEAFPNGAGLVFDHSLVIEVL
jgi:hypothetical protein